MASGAVVGAALVCAADDTSLPPFSVGTDAALAGAAAALAVVEDEEAAAEVEEVEEAVVAGLLEPTESLELKTPAIMPTNDLGCAGDDANFLPPSPRGDTRPLLVVPARVIPEEDDDDDDDDEPEEGEAGAPVSSVRLAPPRRPMLLAVSERAASITGQQWESERASERAARICGAKRVTRTTLWLVFDRRSKQERQSECAMR